MRLLILQDSSDLTETMVASLSKFGFEATVAVSVDRVAEILEESQFDVILMVISQELNTGLELVKQLCKVAPDVPKVTLSVHCDPAIALDFIKCGTQDYLVTKNQSDESISLSLLFAIERHRASQKQRERDLRMMAALEYSHDAYISVNAEWCITEWNSPAERAFGFKRDEMLGKSLSQIVPEHYQTQFITALKRYFAKRHGDLPKASTEITAQHRSGSSFPAECTVIRVKHGTEIVYCTFVHDISKSKKSTDELARRVQEQTEKLTRSNEELKQFAKIASHDLQEPLRAVQGFANLLAEATAGQLDDNCKDFINYILDGIRRMQQLIQSILVHSQIDTTIDITRVTDCNDVIREVSANMRDSFEESGATLDAHILPEVAVERSQLVQLFQNLISNSIRYRSDEPPVISIAAEQSLNQWLFSVRDNGIGVEPQYADKIFEMFSRLHAKGKYPGTGIGLAICKRIITLHGGNIWIDSKSGQGANFMFTLPATKTKRNRKMKDRIEILLVEDTPSDVRLTQEALKRTALEYALTVVNDGVEAMDYLNSLKESADFELPHIILLDLNMPRKNGHEVLEEIKNDSVLKSIPVILLTVSERDEDVSQALELKMNYYLAKPVTSQKIAALIKGLAELHNDEADDFIFSDEEAHVRLVLAGNPHTSLIALKKLADDPRERVRCRLAENANLSEELQFKLAGDSQPDVRISLCENKNLSAKVIEKLAVDESVDVRLAVSQSPCATTAILTAMANDENVFVSDSAKQSLSAARSK